MRGRLGLLYFFLSLPWLVSCGDEGLSEKIAIGVSPEKPFMATADSSYVGVDGETVAVTAPWTKATFTITNNHESLYLYVDSLTITFENLDGSTSTSTVSYAEVGCDTGAARTLYANLAPGESFDGDVNCDNVDDANDTETWYFQSLPAEDDNPVLSATIELSGFFHDNDTTSPTDRAKKFKYFVTR
jgi:hypothetical protein